MNKLLFPFLSLLAAVGMYFLYIGPTYDQIKLLQAKEAEFDRAFLEVREVRNILEKLESSYSGISNEDLLRLEIFLPKKIDIVRVVQNVGGIVGAYNVPMEGIRVNEAVKEPDEPAEIRTHTMSFSIEADYADFLSILSDIESNLQLTNISSIELQPVPTGDSGIEIASTVYDLELTFYSYE